MIPVDLTLPFLAQRSYLHGTTLFDVLRTYAPPDAALGFKVARRIESNRVRLEAGVGAGGRKAQVSASLLWRLGDRREGLLVIPLAPLQPVERLPYDEALVTRAVALENDRAVLRAHSPFTFVATLVPMFKVLLASLHPMNSVGQWMFTRLDAARVPARWQELALRLDIVRAGALARSTVFCDEKPCGELYYSWVV